MTKNLTEQWKKGELEEGFYYVDDGAEVTIDYYLCDYWERHFDSDVQQVLAPVPSYEEYSRLEWYAGCGPDRIVELNHENRKLKELLKECQDIIQWYKADCGYKDTPTENVLTKIDEVLK